MPHNSYAFCHVIHILCDCVCCESGCRLNILRMAVVCSSVTGTCSVSFSVLYCSMKMYTQKYIRTCTHTYALILASGTMCFVCKFAITAKQKLSKSSEDVLRIALKHSVLVTFSIYLCYSFRHFPPIFLFYYALFQCECECMQRVCTSVYILFGTLNATLFHLF